MNVPWGVKPGLTFYTQIEEGEITESEAATRVLTVHQEV